MNLLHVTQIYYYIYLQMMKFLHISNKKRKRKKSCCTMNYYHDEVVFLQYVQWNSNQCSWSIIIGQLPVDPRVDHKYNYWIHKLKDLAIKNLIIMSQFVSGTIQIFNFLHSLFVVYMHDMLCLTNSRKRMMLLL